MLLRCVIRSFGAGLRCSCDRRLLSVYCSDAIIRVKTVLSLRGGALLLLSDISHLEEHFWMQLSFLIDTTDDEGEK